MPRPLTTVVREGPPCPRGRKATPLRALDALSPTWAGPHTAPAFGPTSPRGLPSPGTRPALLFLPAAGSAAPAGPGRSRRPARTAGAAPGRACGRLRAGGFETAAPGAAQRRRPISAPDFSRWFWPEEGAGPPRRIAGAAVTAAAAVTESLRLPPVPRPRVPAAASARLLGEKDVLGHRSVGPGARRAGGLLSQRKGGEEEEKEAAAAAPAAAAAGHTVPQAPGGRRERRRRQRRRPGGCCERALRGRALCGGGVGLGVGTRCPPHPPGPPQPRLRFLRRTTAPLSLRGDFLFFTYNFLVAPAAPRLRSDCCVAESSDAVLPSSSSSSSSFSSVGAAGGRCCIKRRGPGGAISAQRSEERRSRGGGGGAVRREKNTHTKSPPPEPHPLPPRGGGQLGCPRGCGIGEAPRALRRG